MNELGVTGGGGTSFMVMCLRLVDLGILHFVGEVMGGGGLFFGIRL